MHGLLPKHSKNPNCGDPSRVQLLCWVNCKEGLELFMVFDDTQVLNPIDATTFGFFAYFQSQRQAFCKQILMTCGSKQVPWFRFPVLSQP